MEAVLSFKTFIRHECRTSSDTSQRWFSSGNPYILAPHGVDLNHKTFLRLECRTSSDTSQSMDFLGKSIHSRSLSGYGSNPKIFPPPRMPDLIRHLRINGFPLESIYSPLSYWGGSKSRKADTREHTDPDTKNALEPTDAPKSQKDLVPDLVPGPNKSAWPVSAALS